MNPQDELEPNFIPEEFETNIVPTGGGTVMKGGSMNSLNYKTGESGWNINSEGNAEFNDGTFRGDLEANSIAIPDATTANSFHVNSDGDAWWGAAAIVSALAKILKTGYATFAGLTVLNMKAYTNFESDTRFTYTVIGNGTCIVGTNGLELWSGATQNNSAKATWTAALKIFNGSPTFSCGVTDASITIANGVGSAFFGLGNITTAGAGHTFTNAHIGFKIIKTGGVATLYATQADGTTENVSSALTTITTNDFFDLILKVNGDSSVDYYWKKNAGTLSSATNLTSNLPTGSMSYIQFSTSNNNTAYNFDWLVYSASFER